MLDPALFFPLLFLDLQHRACQRKTILHSLPKPIPIRCRPVFINITASKTQLSIYRQKIPDPPDRSKKLYLTGEIDSPEIHNATESNLLLHPYNVVYNYYGRPYFERRITSCSSALFIPNYYARNLYSSSFTHIHNHNHQ